MSTKPQLLLPLRSNIVAPALEELGVRAVKKNNAETEFLIGIEENLSEVEGFVGPEPEVTFGGGNKDLRTAVAKMLRYTESNLPTVSAMTLARDYFPNYGSILLTDRIVLSNPSMVVQFGVKNLLSKSPVVYGIPHDDAGGIECKMRPVSELAARRLKPEYDRILSIYKELGYTDEVQGAGMHIYIDHTLFGESINEIYENIGSFFWFLFEGSEQMLSISNRKYASQFNADMRSLLDDGQGCLSDAEYKRAFIKQKDLALRAFQDNTSARFINIHFHRKKRAAIEFRWFAATTNVDTFMANIEFGFSIPKWLRQTNRSDVSFGNFMKFLKSHPEQYAHILNHLRTTCLGN